MREERMTWGKATLIVATVICLADTILAGSCRSAKLCCQGRDSGCVIQKESSNSVVDSPRDKPCYCDHACLKLADCCDDFKETCGVVDCEVSEWSPWTPCNNRCGSGTQRRSRVIEVSEKNGGKHCPRLDQVRNCRSFEACDTGIHFRDKSVTLLASFRGNGTDFRTTNAIPDKSRSCVAFTIVRASRTCSKISSSLTEGSRVCVERHADEKLADIGRWKLSTIGSDVGRSANSSCHGKWIGDSRSLIDCSDPRCLHLPHLPHHRRTRRSVVETDERISTTRDRTSRRRRRRGRRRKRSRRRNEAVDEP